MKYALRLYGDLDSNPDGFPDSIIYERLVVPDDEVGIPTGYSLLKTEDEVTAYIAAHAADYVTFNNMILAKQELQAAYKASDDNFENRMAEGIKIVKDFRRYCIRKQVNISDSITLLTQLQAALPFLQLGLMGPAAYILTNITTSAFLNAAIDSDVAASLNFTFTEGMTLKAYFLQRVNEANV